jgi:carotenoid cleavage dioxygenase-like enzyme
MDATLATMTTRSSARAPARLGTAPPFALDVGGAVDDFIEAGATLRGRLPEWLRGDLLRTCPAIFSRGRWEARHWFDGLGLLYAFRVDGDAVRFRARLLDSEDARAVAAGREPHTGFGTPIRRGLFRRLIQPVAPATDNANVNILTIGDDTVALTEGPYQPIVDPLTLEVRGRVAYDDDLPVRAFMTARPHFDFARQQVVNVITHLGASSWVGVYEHGPRSRTRRLVAKWPTRRVPYVHSFGLTPTAAILIAHPLDVSPMRFLWSNRGYIDHFEWRASQPTRLLTFDRATGASTEAETDPLFVFHTAHAFDDGDDRVVDLCAYADASIVEAVRSDRLAERIPTFTSQLVRLRISRDGRVRREQLADVPFEFPSISYRRAEGRAEQVVWGATSGYDGDAYRSSVVRVDVPTGRVSRLAESGWLFGEPVYVARPDGTAEDDGVLLTVAHGLDRRATALAVLDARSLDVVAWAEIPAAIPLGFHGSFRRR